jgi:hypothetical protein
VRAGGGGREIAGKTGRSGAACRQAGFIGCPGWQTIREDFIMGVKLGFLVTLEAKDGKGEELVLQQSLVISESAGVVRFAGGGLTAAAPA